MKQKCSRRAWSSEKKDCLRQDEGKKKYLCDFPVFCYWTEGQLSLFWTAENKLINTKQAGAQQIVAQFL